jgi:chemotaxis-related protein WspB
MVERATETVSFPPEAFRPAGVAVNGARYLGPVARDARGLIQRIEVAALLTNEMRAALFSEDEAHPTGGGASAP